MSGLAGTLRFDPRQSVEEELKLLQSGIVSIGPDGCDAFKREGFGMVYSGFQTTPEEVNQTQPLCIEQIVAGFDGRLDNREDIHGGLRIELPLAQCTDAYLVAFAFAKRGVDCLVTLEGDWAVAVWDLVTRELTLARDSMGVRRLFYRLDREGLSWCSRVEPLLDTAGRALTLDREYIHNYFVSRPPAHATAFQEIRSVLPSHWVRIDSRGRVLQRCYWSLTPQDRVKVKSEAEYDEEFRHLLTNAVRRRMRSNTAVLAELSGGLDSSSIVCTADLVSSELTSPAVTTLSYFDSEEPSGDERPYFTAIEAHRGSPGLHVSVAELRQSYSDRELAPLPKPFRIAAPGYFEKSLIWSKRLEEVHQQAGARVVLSGVGGDELLGGVQDEAPELADYLGEGRVASFARSSIAWGIRKQRPVYSLWRNAAELLLSQYVPAIHSRSLRRPIPEWLLTVASGHDPYLAGFAPWRNLRPTSVAMERDRYYLGAQLTCMDPPLVGCIERRYPLLDRDLYRFLARVPREQIVSASSRRRLLRRALRSVVPEVVLSRKTKWFGQRAAGRGLNSDIVTAMFRERWLSDSFIDAPLLRTHLEDARAGIGEPTLFTAAIGFEQWLRTLPWKVRMD